MILSTSWESKLRELSLASVSRNHHLSPLSLNATSWVTVIWHLLRLSSHRTWWWSKIWQRLRRLVWEASHTARLLDHSYTSQFVHAPTFQLLWELFPSTKACRAPDIRRQSSESWYTWSALLLWVFSIARILAVPFRCTEIHTGPLIRKTATVSPEWSPILDQTLCPLLLVSNLLPQFQSVRQYVALFKACRDSVWIRSLLRELDACPGNTPTPIMHDKQGSISWAQGGLLRLKHVELKYHYTQNFMSSDQITVSYIPSTKNKADLSFFYAQNVCDVWERMFWWLWHITTT